MSKGSTSRPFSVSNEEYANRWDAIFGIDNEKKKNNEYILQEDDWLVDIPVDNEEDNIRW